MIGIRAWSLSILLSCWLLGGCGAEKENPAAQTPSGTPKAIAPEPNLSLGVAAGDAIQEFYEVRTPFVMPGGRLAIPLKGTGEVRVFGGEGEILKSFGRRGEGPGEFAALTAAWARGDTIEALDGDLMRITRFFPDGRTQVIRLDADRRGDTAPRGAIPGGWVTVGFEGFAESGRDLWSLQLFEKDGALTGELAQLEGIARISVPGYSGAHPLSPRAVLRAAQGRLYLAETLTPRIQVLSLAGGVEREISWETEEWLTPREAMSLVREAATSGDTPDHVAGQLLRTDEIPSRMSVFWDFLVDELGFIWIRSYDPVKHSFSFVRFLGGGYISGTSGEGGAWRIFSPEGVEVGVVEVPEGLAPAQITRDALVGIRTDPALGFESVEVYALTRY